MRWHFGLLICLSILLLSCANQTPDQPTPTAFGDLSVITAGTGSAQVFSGRPNPRWTLNADDVVHIQQVLQTAAPAPKPSEMPGLGYSGMLVELISPQNSIYITIFDEVITVHQASSAHYLVDAERAFERWLIEQSRSQLEPAIYDLIKSNLP